MTPPTPRAARARASTSASSGVRRSWPGSDAIGERPPRPGTTKSGATSIAGWRRVSRTSARSAGVRRVRRSRWPAAGAGIETGVAGSAAGSPATGSRREVIGTPRWHGAPRRRPGMGGWGRRDDGRDEVGQGVDGLDLRPPRPGRSRRRARRPAVEGPMQQAGVPEGGAALAGGSRARSPRTVEPLVNTTTSTPSRNAARSGRRAASGASIVWYATMSSTSAPRARSRAGRMSSAASERARRTLSPGASGSSSASDAPPARLGTNADAPAPAREAPRRWPRRRPRSGRPPAWRRPVRPAVGQGLGAAGARDDHPAVPREVRSRVVQGAARHHRPQLDRRDHDGVDSAGRAARRRGRRVGRARG